MLEGIRNFYIEHIASLEIRITPTGTSVKKISPVTRIEFCFGSALATVLLVQKIAQSTFYFLAAVFTGFKNESIQESMRLSCRDVGVFLGAIVVGNLGFFIPQTANNYWLRIPVEGIVVPRSL